MDASERHVDFVADGKVTPEYGIAFTKADGLRILGFERAELTPPVQLDVGHSATAGMDSLVKRSSTEIRVEGNDALKIQAEISAARADLSRTEDEPVRRELEEQLRQANERLAELEAKQ